jgi:YggT family protein
VSEILCTLLWLYWVVLFVRILMSWFPITPGSPLESVHSVLFSLTEPVLAPVRQLVPPLRMGMAAIDLSAIIVLIGLNILQRVIC